MFDDYSKALQKYANLVITFTNFKGDKRVYPIVLLYSASVATATSLCVAELWSFQDLDSEKKGFLLTLYLPWLLIPLTMAVWAYRALMNSIRIIPPRKTPKQKRTQKVD